MAALSPAPCAARKPRVAVPQPYCSARARAAARRDRSGQASTARTPAARSSPGTLVPASPTTSGSADSALTTTGVPQARASSAASPNVSAGPGAMATSALASSAASSARPARNPVKVTGSPARAARRPSRVRSGPPPATTSRTGTPSARSVASVFSDRCGFFSADSRPQCTSRTCPAPTYRVRTRPARGENVARSSPGGTPVEPVRHGQGERRPQPAGTDAGQLEQGRDALVGHHDGGDAVPARPRPGPAQRGPVRHLQDVGPQPGQQPGQPPAAPQHPVPAGERQPGRPQRDHPPLRGLLVAVALARDDQDGLVSRGQVARAQLGQRGAQAAGVRRDEVGQPDDPHMATLARFLVPRTWE